MNDIKQRMSGVKFILTDIEGTTSSVSFVLDVLFPYFLQNSGKLKDMEGNPIVQEAFEMTQEILFSEENRRIQSLDEAIEQWNQWCRMDRKITPLKAVQGIVWAEGFRSGAIQGHVYEEVPHFLKRWFEEGRGLGVFSSGSIAAQKLLFGHTLYGDLSVFFSHYFDTTTGGKKEAATYPKIADALGVTSNEICFLSDIVEELNAAESCGMKTVQLLRETTASNWHTVANDFAGVDLLIHS
jgi:enolase-phosphatase E1